MRILGRLRRSCEDNIKKYLRVIGCKDVGPLWIHLAHFKVQWRDLVNTVMNLRGFMKGKEFLDQMSDY
jgi:hypothetical protein